MPPKIPNMKFKPKLVRSTKPEVQENDDGMDEELAQRQIERLQRAQQELQEQEQVATSSSVKTLPGTEPQKSLSSSRSVGGAGASLKQFHSDKKASSSNAHSPSGHSLSDWFHEAHETPLTAPPLPPNTLHTVLTGASSGSLQEYPPVPLDFSPGGAPSPGSAGGTAIQDDATVGTAFLRAMDDELRVLRQRNRDFYEKVLRPSNAGSGSGTEDGRGSLVWLQIPRLHSAGESSALPFDLHHLPPGKIGEVQVWQSGRMTVEINGCCFDISAEAAEESAGGGTCSLAAMTRSESELGEASCCFLDVLQQKLVCTPTMEEIGRELEPHTQK